ncbi:unnamed protein product, partial [Polarella glacialis]
VFKTQSANAQFWGALGYVDKLQQTLRTIAMISCGVFDWKKESIKPCCKKIVRCLVLYYYVMIENFQRTGANQTMSVKVQDALRNDIRHLTGPKEFAMLFPNEDVKTSGSDSIYTAANPSIVLFWITVVVGNAIKEQAVPPPIGAAVLGHIHSLGTAFFGMERIDKTQFALPYAQIVKLLSLVFVGSLPFIVVKQSGNATYFISLLATIGFFGLDQVAEILESPFGQDANDIQLRDYGESLMQDLEVMYRARDMELDTVITGDDDINFQEILNKHSPGGLVRSKSKLSRHSMHHNSLRTVATMSKLPNLTSVTPSEGLA